MCRLLSSAGLKTSAPTIIVGAYSGENLLAEGVHFSKSEAGSEACRIALTTFYAQVHHACYLCARGGGGSIPFLGVLFCLAILLNPFGMSPLPLQKLADAPLPSEADDYSPEDEVRIRVGGKGRGRWVELSYS